MAQVMSRLTARGPEAQYFPWAWALSMAAGKSRRSKKLMTGERRYAKRLPSRMGVRASSSFFSRAMRVRLPKNVS